MPRHHSFRPEVFTQVLQGILKILAFVPVGFRGSKNGMLLPRALRPPKQAPKTHKRLEMPHGMCVQHFRVQRQKPAWTNASQACTNLYFNAPTYRWS